MDNRFGLDGSIPRVVVAVDVLVGVEVVTPPLGSWFGMDLGGAVGAAGFGSGRNDDGMLVMVVVTVDALVESNIRFDGRSCCCSIE